MHLSTSTSILAMALGVTTEPRYVKSSIHSTQLSSNGCPLFFIDVVPSHHQLGLMEVHSQALLHHSTTSWLALLQLRWLPRVLRHIQVDHPSADSHTHSWLGLVKSFWSNLWSRTPSVPADWDVHCSNTRQVWRLNSTGAIAHPYLKPFSTSISSTLMSTLAFMPSWND